MADFVEHGRVGRTPVYLTLEHVLVRSAIVLPGGADLHLDADHRDIGVEDQRPELPADVQHNSLGMTPSGEVLSRCLMAVIVDLALAVGMAVHRDRSLLLGARREFE